MAAQGCIGSICRCQLSYHNHGLLLSIVAEFSLCHLHLCHVIFLCFRAQLSPVSESRKTDTGVFEPPQCHSVWTEIFVGLKVDVLLSALRLSGYGCLIRLRGMPRAGTTNTFKLFRFRKRCLARTLMCGSDSGAPSPTTAPHGRHHTILTSC